jgi:hypothetical protein
MRISRQVSLLVFAVLFSATARTLLGQAVTVTAKLDTNRIAIGSSTTLRIYAQVAPAYRANAERIFSWYVDVLNTNGLTVQANYNAMQKTASDKDPQTSSTGVNSGVNRLGIYDTFQNLPGAGVPSPVELMSFPVSGLAVGQTRFVVRHGSGVDALSDFIVAPLTGDDPYFGGDYAQAFADLTIVSGPANPVKSLSIAQTNLPGGSHQVSLRYAAVPGYDCYVEYRNQLVGGVDWQAFPGAPHNSGLYRDTNSVPARFYRLRLAPAGTLAPFLLDIVRTAIPGQLRLTFPTVTGYNYAVESRSNAATGTWQTLGGVPHNSGVVNVDNNGSQSFYRVRVSAQ